MTRLGPAQVTDLGAPEEQAAATSPQTCTVPGPRQVLTREPEGDDVGLNSVQLRVVDVLELLGLRPVLGQDLSGRSVVVAHSNQISGLAWHSLSKGQL